MELEHNPFVDIGYRGSEYFCDREDETELLRKYIDNQTNTTLFAFRRLGKTGLIQHVFESFKKSKKQMCIYVDILSTTDKASFINQLATAIYAAFPENNGIGKQIIEAIKLLRPTIQFDELTGQPSVGITTINQQQQEATIATLFGFLDSQNVKIVFALDEFQQILAYPEKNMEALLRTQMQALKNTSFIFCGSNQAIMHEIFNDAKRPFFASCTYMSLHFIPKKNYGNFIKKLFKKYAKSISNEAVDFICDWTSLHTFYTQYFCNQLFAKGILDIDITDVKLLASDILALQEAKFYQYRTLLTKAQWNLLKAIANEQRLFKPHAKAFIIKSGLGSSSIVTRTLDALLAKEMVYRNTQIEKPYYEVYDKFLMRWLQSKK